MKQLIVAGASLAVGGVLGVVAGFAYASNKYEALLQEEIASVKKHYALIRKENGELSTYGAAQKQTAVSDEALDTFNEGVKDALTKAKLDGLMSHYINTVDEDGDEEEYVPTKEDEGKAREMLSIFENEERDWSGEMDEDNYEYHDGLPYRIKSVDFFNSSEEYAKETLTYYEGDDILVDDKNAIVNDTETVVGDRHLSMFGWGSDDKNVVYVRNEALDTDFEVIRNPSKYETVVLGIPEDDAPRVKRMRDDE